MPPWCLSAEWKKANYPEDYYRLKLENLDQFGRFAVLEQVPVPCAVLKCVYIHPMVYFMDTKECKFHHEFLMWQKLDTRYAPSCISRSSPFF
jgi:hypothetical protein